MLLLNTQVSSRKRMSKEKSPDIQPDVELEALVNNNLSITEAARTLGVIGDDLQRSYRLETRKNYLQEAAFGCVILVGVYAMYQYWNK